MELRNMQGTQKAVLETVDEIVKAAGGNTVVARKLGYRDGRAVWNWRKQGTFPSHTYTAWQKILDDMNISAPAELCKQKRV